MLDLPALRERKEPKGLREQQEPSDPQALKELRE
jgi:hypothetical protein